MIVITIAAIAGLIIALGGCLNKIADMKWDIELIEAHSRELERLLQQMEQETLDKKQFDAFNLKIEEIA